MAQPDQLDRRIRSLVSALGDAAPPAPPFPATDEVSANRRRRTKRRALYLVPLVVAVLGGSAAATISAVVRTSPGVLRLFVRQTASGEQIRAYLMAGSNSNPSYLQGELSTDRAVGELSANSVNVGSAKDFLVESSTVFGTRENGAGAVAIRTGSAVALVRARFTGGRHDSMRPVDGWAIVGTRGVDIRGSIEAFDSRGRSLGSAGIPSPTPSGEGFQGESVATFDRITSQGVVIIGHTVRGADGGYWVYPYIADRYAVQLGIEGIPACHPKAPTALDGQVAVLGLQEGSPITVVIVYAGRSITRVEIHYSNGVGDGMKTVGGSAVLATIGTIARSGRLDTLKHATLDGFDARGRLVAKRRLSPLAYGLCSSWLPAN